ncbi:MAG TPA: hypothetical protein VEV16_12880 [Daejeonella sp.]|nr:hypothetical protein [Daejeonella sp.]
MNQENNSYPYEPEFSFKQIITNRLNDLKYLRKFKKHLALATLVGALLGALAAWKWPHTYTARLTFVVEDPKGAGGGGLAALAGQFGFNMEGLAGGGGVLAGDNVQELLKSRKLINETLLSPYDDEGKQSLADRYAQAYKLKKAWLKYSPDGKEISFPVGGKNNTRLQDSLLFDITFRVLEGQFRIAKTDKKLGFFEVNTVMRDERLAQLFCERMIKQATDFFIQTKTSRLRNNVRRLQHRADSLNAILNRKTYSVSVANQNLLDLNPAYAAVNSQVEIKERDKIVLSTIYTETVKNLEASKTMLAQETPTVQIVDEPELPLKRNQIKYPKGIVLGALLGLFLMAMYKLIMR